MAINTNYSPTNKLYFGHNEKYRQGARTKAPSFCAGKMHLWFDSDGTYFPTDDQNLLKPDKRGCDAFKELKSSFERFNQFVRRFSKQVELNITTGRNRGEYRHYLNLIKDAGLDWIIPDRLVIKNGGDVFLKNAISDDGNINPGWPSVRHIDQVKRDEIKRLTSWDGDYIRSSIISTLEDWDFPVIVGPSGLEDYGSKSYKHFWQATKDKYNDPWVAFVRQDGALNFYVGLPVDGSAKDIQESIVNDIKARLDKKKISYELEFRQSDWENSGGPAIIITPKIGDIPINKSFDIAKEIDRAKKENDLVIVAGNGANDRIMLNPETYSKEPVKDNLPLMSIVVGDDKSLEDLPKKYADNVIKVKDANSLLDGVKEAVRRYSERNKGFKDSIDPEIAGEIGIKK